MDVRFFCGIGDILAMQSHWSPDFISSVNKIYIRPYQHIVLETFNNCKETKHIKCLPIDYEYYDEKASDWSMWARANQIKNGVFQFYGSPFIRNKVANINHIKVPKKYFIIQHQTTSNPMYIRDVRDMESWEWRSVIRILEENDAFGIVVNNGAGDPAPKHDRIIDMIGQTTFAESLELLKKASGYLGIDSWLSVMAAQLFDAKHLWIRGKTNWVKKSPDFYYKPHTQFDFLRPYIGEMPKFM